jgi:hypothetical protein
MFLMFGGLKQVPGGLLKARIRPDAVSDPTNVAGYHQSILGRRDAPPAAWLDHHLYASAVIIPLLH